MSIDLEHALNRIDEMEREMDEFRQLHRRCRVQSVFALASVVGAILLLPASRQAIAQGYGVTLATLNTRLLAVEAKTQFQSSDATEKSTTFSGCNLVVNDGGGSTNAVVSNAAGHGLGNLIIGYNAAGNNQAPDNRSGVHNLVLGDRNNYSSYGGFVVGTDNIISASYACISGGQDNIASDVFASVSGGYYNQATAPYSSVTAGNGNVASDYYATVSGGGGNKATGNAGAVSGGEDNTASGDSASVGGGSHNSATWVTATVSGGLNVTENTFNGWAAGGGGGGTYHSP